MTVPHTLLYVRIHSLQRPLALTRGTLTLAATTVTTAPQRPTTAYLHRLFGTSLLWTHR